MVFESLFDAKEIRSRPWLMVPLGIIYSSIGILVSLLVFPSSPSISAVFFSTIAAIPLLVRALKIEEEEDFSKKEYPLIGNHMDVLGILFFLFLGLLLSYTAWGLMLPSSLNNKVFSSQVETIKSISSNVSIEGSFTRQEFVQIILLNNFKVLFLCLLFSLIYGSGAIFIITWNASVLATAISRTIQESLKSLSYLEAVPLGFGQYLLHGIPEVTAYFIGGIAGGIISAAVIRHGFNSKKFREVLLDSIDLIILASVILIISAFIEAYISVGV